MLEQSQTSGLWKQIPFYVPSLDKNLEIPSYTSLARLRDERGALLAQTKVLLSSSSWVTATVNGSTITVNPEGVDVDTDARGRLNTVLLVSDISSCTFRLKSISDSDPAEPLVIDSSHKTRSKLSDISADQLRKAKRSDGTPLINPDADVEGAASAIRQLHGMISEAEERGKYNNVEALADPLWSFWHWVKEKIDEVTKRIIEGGKFLVRVPVFVIPLPSSPSRSPSPKILSNSSSILPRTS